MGGMNMKETILTEEDRKNLKIISEELPKVRQLLEELIETMEILSDEELMKSIRESEKDLREGRTLTYKQLLEELDINEKEI